MNSYEIQFRKAGAASLSHCDQYHVIADSLEDAIERVKTEIPKDYGSELRYEFVSARETACNVILPKMKAATGKR